MEHSQLLPSIRMFLMFLDSEGTRSPCHEPCTTLKARASTKLVGTIFNKAFDFQAC
jgi:hypothetical protein